MIKLINIELKKIFMHKSIYVVMGIIIIFCLINNVLYKVDYDNDGNYKYGEDKSVSDEIEEVEDELEKYNLAKDSDKIMYITIKSKIDCAKIKLDYDSNTWQYIKSSDYLYDSIYNINYYTYVDKDQGLLNEVIEEYNEIIKYFKDDNWEYFVKLEKREIEDKIEIINEEISNTYDKSVINSLEMTRKEYKDDLMIANYRLIKDINYGNHYLNRSLLEYRENIKVIDSYDKNKSSYQEKINYNNELERSNINKYIIDNNVNVEKVNTLNYQLRSIVDDYELFIIIIILIVTSILIGEEFNKGTIKFLLVKPYMRGKILLSKYLASVLVIVLVVLFIIIVQFIIGGMLLGFGSLRELVPVYNFSLDKLEAFNIFIYMLIRCLIRMPMFIMVLTISFVVSLLINNTIGSFAVSMLLYTFSEVINSMIVNYNIKFMNFFVTLNWDFREYLFGGMAKVSFLSLKKSIVIYIIYVIILLGVMFSYFKKKDIRNI